MFKTRQVHHIEESSLQAHIYVIETKRKKKEKHMAFLSSSSIALLKSCGEELCSTHHRAFFNCRVHHLALHRSLKHITRAVARASALQTVFRANAKRAYLGRLQPPCRHRGDAAAPSRGGGGDRDAEAGHLDSAVARAEKGVRFEVFTRVEGLLASRRRVHGCLRHCLRMRLAQLGWLQSWGR